MWKTAVCLISIMTLINACTSEQDIDAALENMLQHSVPVISTEQLTQIQSDEEVVLLDSREEDEFKLSHLPQSLWVGYETFDLSTLADIPKDKKIVVYCSIGVRSEKIAEQLVSAGFSDVYNLYGGIFAWANENKPLVNHHQQPTRNVHGYDQKWAKLLEQHVPSPQRTN